MNEELCGMNMRDCKVGNKVIEIMVEWENLVKKEKYFIDDCIFLINWICFYL